MAKIRKIVAPRANVTPPLTPIERFATSRAFLTFVTLLLWSAMVWLVALNLLIFQAPAECSTTPTEQPTSSNKGRVTPLVELALLVDIIPNAAIQGAVVSKLLCKLWIQWNAQQLHLSGLKRLTLGAFS